MGKLFNKKLLGIPVTILLVLALAVGAVMAAESFLSFTTTITVDEPLLVEYNLKGEYGGNNNWHPLGDEDSLTVQGSAGDIFNIYLRIWNRASDSLWVTTVVTGDIEWFDITGLPNGTIQKSTLDDSVPEWEGLMVLKIKGDTPTNLAPGYKVTLTFNRS